MISKALTALLYCCLSSSSFAGPPRCADPCLFLQDTPIDKLPDAFKAACPAAKGQDATLADCAVVDYARNCIYAAHGVAFKKKKWRDMFAAKPWYQSHGLDAAKVVLSDVERSNVKALARRGRACKRDFRIDDADLARARAWLAALPKAPMPKLVFFGGTPVAGTELANGIQEQLDQHDATADPNGAKYVKLDAKEVPAALVAALAKRAPRSRLVELDFALEIEDDAIIDGMFIWLAYDAANQLVAVAADAYH
ncbi:MAG TPA: YARHG domain-containing protein [Kofleriaceae bacterium]|nr:YARHG domain-containing protein [Kofleriaceae bacterium]